MQPYAIIGKPNTHQSLPPKPTSWSSKHRGEGQGQRMQESNSSSSLSHNYGLEKASPTNQHPYQPQTSTMNRQSFPGYDNPEGNSNGMYSQKKGITQTESHYYQDGISPVKEYEREVAPVPKDYAIRLQGFQQTAPNQERYSYTRKLTNDRGKEDTNDIFSFNKKSDNKGDKVVMQSEIQKVQKNKFRNLYRDLGIFQREKQYTDELILTKKELRVLTMQQSEAYPVPKMDASASSMLASMKPSPNNIQDYVVPVQSRVSNESVSSRPRIPIFTNSRVQHFEDSSKWPYQNTSGNIYKKDNEIHFQEMEQSEVTPMGYSLKREQEPSNQIQGSPHKRQKIFDQEERHNESRSISFGQLEESDPAAGRIKQSFEDNIQKEGYGDTGGQKSSTCTRNLIFEGGEQRNEERGDVKKHRRELSSSSKFSGNASLKFEGYN